MKNRVIRAVERAAKIVEISQANLPWDRSEVRENKITLD